MAPDGVDAVYDTALLYREAFPAVRDGGQIVFVRGWDGNEVEDRGVRVHPVMVARVLERTDWLEELRALASAGRLKLRVAGEYPPERAGEAQRAMEAGGLRGRAVIVFWAIRLVGVGGSRSVRSRISLREFGTRCR